VSTLEFLHPGFLALALLAPLAGCEPKRARGRTTKLAALRALVVALLALAAAAASLVAIVAVLRGHAASGAGLAWPQVALSLLTLGGGWLLMTVEFALAYASRFHAHGSAGGGLAFPSPGDGPPPAPHFTDFVYFALTISATAQTSDVGVTTPSMRRLVLMHAALAFAFNATVLTLAINIVAGLI